MAGINTELFIDLATELAKLGFEVESKRVWSEGKIYPAIKLNKNSKLFIFMDNNGWFHMKGTTIGPLACAPMIEQVTNWWSKHGKQECTKVRPAKYRTSAARIPC